MANNSLVWLWKNITKKLSLPLDRNALTYRFFTMQAIFPVVGTIFFPVSAISHPSDLNERGCFCFEVLSGKNQTILSDAISLRTFA
ncbi:MAG: hypothetical protein ACK5NG_09370 [Chthoniobacterales bacterium]